GIAVLLLLATAGGVFVALEPERAGDLILERFVPLERKTLAAERLAIVLPLAGPAAAATGVLAVAAALARALLRRGRPADAALAALALGLGLVGVELPWLARPVGPIISVKGAAEI